jgi:hypothetical protein
MSHTDIIWILVTITFSSTLGVYVAIKKINQYTRPPVNTLVRSGDIELGDIIESSTIYQDLLQPPQQIYYCERVHSMPPSYHTVERGYINSCLENSINLEFILRIIKLRNLNFIVLYVEKHLFWQKKGV